MSSEDYSESLVKRYSFWDVRLHENQSYLGRLVVWATREDAQDLSDATSAEQEELFVVLRDAREALRQAFQPTWFNYAFLGNAVPHLHCHLVPRYETPRSFAGHIFEDKLYGHHYRTDHTFVTTPQLLADVRNKLREGF